MSRKTKKQKIQAEIKRQREITTESLPQPIHYQLSPAKENATHQNSPPPLPWKHDLIKTVLLTVLAIVGQLCLYYFVFEGR